MDTGSWSPARSRRRPRRGPGSSLRAARICNAAETDQILVTDTVRSEHGNAELFQVLGRRQLKGFAAPVDVALCVWSDRR